MKEFLSQHDIAYTEKNVRTNPAARQEVRALGFLTVPVTVIGGMAIQGFDREKLAAALGLPS